MPANAPPRRPAFSSRTARAPLSWAVLALGLSVAACAVNDADLSRWEGTQRGPGKLYAVLVHDKYSLDLRTHAALELVQMPPRGGNRIGISRLTERHTNEDGEVVEGALRVLSDAERQALLQRLAPQLIAHMDAEPPARLADGSLPQDPSIPYKDAAFALLVAKPPLLSDAEVRASLEAACARWAQAHFVERIDNSSQQYGVEQMVRTLGATAVRELPALIREDISRFDRVVALIADVGDAATKKSAAERLVALAKHLDSSEWTAAQTRFIEEYNQKTHTKASAEQLKGQVEKVRERRFSDEVFPAMKRLVAERVVIDALLGYAADAARPAERRKLALAALEGYGDKGTAADADKLFELAKNTELPDELRDVAFARLGELPKATVLPKLYTLFEAEQWKVRWVAASLALELIDVGELGEFFAKLPATSKIKQGATEGLSYGAAIAKMEAKGGKTPRELIVAELGSRSFGAKMAAVGFFFEGSKADLGLLGGVAASSEPLPQCTAEEECNWRCDVPKEGSKELEAREPKTVGEFVTMCVVPTLK